MSKCVIVLHTNWYISEDVLQRMVNSIVDNYLSGRSDNPTVIVHQRGVKNDNVYLEMKTALLTRDYPYMQADRLQGAFKPDGGSLDAFIITDEGSSNYGIFFDLVGMGFKPDNIRFLLRENYVG
jgi:hypothetical protein